MKELRPYQKECLNAIWENIKEHVLVSVPTGAGKSLIQAHFLNDALQYSGTKIVIIVPSKELVQQNYNELITEFPDINASIYCAGLKKKDLSGDVVIGTIQSMYNLTQDELKIDLIVFDECHLVPHRAEGRYRDFLAFHPDSRVIGLTATPYRLSGGLLYEGKGALFSKLHYEVQIRDLIASGYLSPIISYAGSDKVDTTGVKKTAGDYNKKEIEQAFIIQNITAAAVRDLKEKAVDRKHILIFSSGLDHGHEIADQLGTDARMIEGKTKDRDKIINDFKAGNFKYLVNMGVLTTGFNFPAVDCVVLLRATQSTGLYVQMVGRGSRIAPGKKNCLLLDYGCNVTTHGTIDNVRPITQGAGKVKRAWECEACGAFNSYSTMECERCNFVRERIERDMTSGLFSKAFDGAVISDGQALNVLDVKHMQIQPHVSKSGNNCIKITYYNNKFYKNGISEYLMPSAPGTAGLKYKRFCIQHGILPTGSMAEFFSQTDDIINPKSIIIKKEGPFWNIIEKIF